MLLRYNIITLEELRRAGEQASDYRGSKSNVAPIGARPATKPTTTGSGQRPLTGSRR